MGLLRLGQSLALAGIVSNLSPVSALAIRNPPNSSIPQHSFDYVIVGGGTAGLVLANRLSETPSVTVAVIEAGTFIEDVYGNSSVVPGYAGRFNGQSPETDWGFFTTPQPDLMNHTFPYWRAKALGGCSSINFMAYGHTSKGAHQLWADTLEDESFLYENMLPYYEKTMDFTPPNAETRFANSTPDFSTSNVVTTGQLGVTYASYSQPWSTWVARGFDALGIARISAYITGNLLGQTWQLTTITQSEGARSSSETAYLRPVLDRENLFVFNGTLAERVVFDGTTATGVLVSGPANNTYTIAANREVILSGGVMQSPQLLQVSGVGPRALLEQFDIPVVADRPGVGRNMWDHITVPISYKVNVLTGSAMEDPVYRASAVEQWNQNRTGPLSSAGGDYHAMEKLPEELRAEWSQTTRDALDSLPDDWPEVSYGVYPNGVLPEGEPGVNYGSILGTLTAPQSRGEITISSASMKDHPLINGNYFTNNADVESMTAIFKRLRQALQSPGMADVIIGEEVFPGPSVQTDGEIVQYLTQSSNPLFHALASNKMGLESDPDAVVDAKGRVYGVSNLRVVDSSSFPFLPPGPAPQIQVYTLAEKQADEIKKDAGDYELEY